LHIRASSLLLCLAVAPLTANAQAPAKQHCSVEPARALTDADNAYIAGNASAAEALWTAQLTSSPSLVSYAGVIRSQLQQNKLDEGLTTSKAVIAAFPNSSEAYTLAGDVLIRVGHIPEASIAFSKALSLDQCSARAHLGWGRVNGMLSHHDIEAHELAAAHALSPNDPEITVAWLEARPILDRAAPLTTLLAAHPNLPPDTIARLTTELAILDQHKFCTPTETSSNAKLLLQPIAFEARYTRGWAFKMNINGNGLGLVELDSSVSGIILNPKDAAKAGVHPLGPTSATEAYTAVADRIRIGDLEYRDCPVRVAPANQLADANSLIGTDFFRANLIHIDYVAQTVTLTPLPSPLTPGNPVDKSAAAQEWTPVYVSGSTLLVPTLIDKQGPFLFVLDTGSWSSILSPSIVSHLTMSTSDSTIDRIGYAGDFVKIKPHEGGINTDRADIYGPDAKLLKVTRPVKLPYFRFAKSELADTSIASFSLTPISHNAGVEISGFLGFRVLQQFSIDLNYRDGLARIVFDQNRRYEQHEAEKQGRPAVY
jgi:tetratricopeptide (TPR) repeat protein